MAEDSRQRARTLLGRAVDFHGHLGPFLILGIRMGVIAQSMLGAKDYNDVTAVVFVNRNPPTSCILDGIQIASGCTLGKGTIQVSESTDHVAGEFHAGNRTCTIRVKPKLVNDLIDGLKKATDKEVLEIADATLARPDEELFQIALGA